MLCMFAGNNLIFLQRGRNLRTNKINDKLENEQLKIIKDKKKTKIKINLNIKIKSLWNSYIDLEVLSIKTNTITLGQIYRKKKTVFQKLENIVKKSEFRYGWVWLYVNKSKQISN